MPSELNEEYVWTALQEIPDPELPAISIVEMGIIQHIQIDPRQGKISVEITPTYTGCPALALIQEHIRTRLLQFGAQVEVNVTMQPSWNSDMLSAAAREKLHSVGIAPPPHVGQGKVLPMLMGHPLTCPYCGSQQTTLENAFGPTPCRAIAYCNSCHQPFEQFKPV
jgi:phenylacetate-CoA oxygenase, PaaJ subunit